MTKQINRMSFADLCSAENEHENLSQIMQAIVIWAGEQTEPGEWVGGIGEQKQRSSKNLRLHLGIIERARELRAGPEVMPTIWTAYQELLVRMAAVPPQRQTLHTAQVVSLEEVQRVLKPQAPAELLRRPLRGRKAG